MTPRRLALGMSLWAPNLSSGIRVRRFADDWTAATVDLHVDVITRNYLKTAFGGSLSAMTDPYFFMLVMHQLGRDYVVWDTRGEIEFVKPGRGVLTAHFEVPRASADALRERAPRRREGARMVRDRHHGCLGGCGRARAPRGLRAREEARDRGGERHASELTAAAMRRSRVSACFASVTPRTISLRREGASAS